MSLTEFGLNLLVGCAHCQGVTSLRTLPLCEECLLTLKNSRPALVELGQPVDSAFALYALNDENYRILKSWKKRRGPVFDRPVLKPIHERPLKEWLDGLASTPQAVVALPQDLKRSLSLGSSPAAVLANAFAKLCKIPLSQILSLRWEPFERRQAELDYWDRLSSPMRFEIAPDLSPPRSLVLVDDFITTGHTAREAARTLKLGGVREVYVLGLGARAASSAIAGDPTDGINRSLAC